MNHHVVRMAAQSFPALQWPLESLNVRFSASLPVLPGHEARKRITTSLSIHKLLQPDMDFGQFIQRVADGAGHVVEESVKATSHVAQAVGGGAAEFTRNAAQTTEHLVETSTGSGRHVARGAADLIRDTGRVWGISAGTDIVATMVQVTGDTAADAVQKVSNVPIGTARGTAEVISFVANTGSYVIEAIGGAAAEGLSLAVRPGELVHRFSQISLDTAYNMVIQRLRTFSLTSTSVMVILILGMSTIAESKARILGADSDSHRTALIYLNYMFEFLYRDNICDHCSGGTALVSVTFPSLIPGLA
jgi:hypothetical protein